jgi:hypothetical protein
MSYLITLLVAVAATYVLTTDTFGLRTKLVAWVKGLFAKKAP